MRLLALLFLIAGVGLAGGAIYYAMEYFEAREAHMANQEPPKQQELQKVVAAKVPLKRGDRLTMAVGKEVLKFVMWPKHAVPENAFISAQDLFGEDGDEVRIVTRAVEPGELLLKTKVTGFGESIRMSTQVREGMRAFTIPINAVTGGGGLLSPGDRVDIQYIRQDGNEFSSHIIMEDVLVVATDQQTDVALSRTRIARTATVEVLPADAQRLTLAQRTGTLTLLLRGINEVAGDNGAIESVDMSQLPGAIKKAEPEPVAPVVEPEDTGYRVKVRKGVKTQEVRFE